jgi:hypothetical protein
MKKGMKRQKKDYEYRHGHIEVLDSNTGDLRCSECGALALIRFSGRLP